MADDAKSILIQDLRNSKFSLTIDESTFVNQSVILVLVRYIEDSIICEEQLLMKTLMLLLARLIKRQDVVFRGFGRRSP